MNCFGILRIFREKLQNNKNWKSRHFRPLRRSVGNPRRDVALRRIVGCLIAARTKVPKWHPLGRPQRSNAMPRRSYCSQRGKFWIFVLKALYSYTDSIGTLIND